MKTPIDQETAERLRRVAAFYRSAALCREYVSGSDEEWERAATTGTPEASASGRWVRPPAPELGDPDPGDPENYFI
jgi:hypothetical protein